MNYYVVYSNPDRVGVLLPSYSEEDALREGAVVLFSSYGPWASLDDIKILKTSIKRMKRVFGGDSQVWRYLREETPWVLLTLEEVTALE